MIFTIRSKPLAATLALVTAAALAACSSGGTDTSHETGINSSSKTITIGFDTVKSGPMSAIGASGDGAEAYFKMVNAAGGVSGYKYKYVAGDSAFQAAQSASVMRTFANEAFVALTTSTPVFLGAEPVAKRLKIPVVAAADGSMFSPGNKGLYSINPIYTRLEMAALDFVAEKFPAAKVAFPYPNGAVGEALAKALPGYAKSKGIEMASVIPVPTDTVNFAPFAAKIADAKPDVILTGILGPAQAAGLMKAVAASGAKTTWMLSFDTMAPEFLDAAGKFADGAYVNNYLLHPQQGTAETKAYLDGMGTYAAKRTDSQFAQQGWTQAAIVDHVIRGILKRGGKLTRTAFVEAMEKLDTGPVGLMPKASISATKRYFPQQSAVYQIDSSNKAKPFTPVTAFTDMPQLASGS